MKTEQSADTLAGRYVLTGQIGSGGMGRVLRARDTVLGRTVALKVLPVDLALKSGFVERFRAEAKAAARVSHPNVVQVHDWGEEGGTYYMVMEYVRGRNLRQILARGALEPAQAAEIMLQVLAGLSAAHEKGLVHRDIKPENVLLASDGTVKVTDFGIARAAEAAGLTGSLMGTVAYAAPEQARGEEVDGRTDLYSAGCLFYELLTGSLPFEGDVVTILHQHLTGRVPAPSRERPESQPLDPVVLSATAPDRADRYTSAAEMRSALVSAAVRLPQSPSLSGLTDELTGEVPLEAMQTALPVARKKRKKLKYLVVVALLMAAAAGWWFFRPSVIPDVAGLSTRAALNRVSGRNFDPVVKRTFSNMPENTVLSSDPPAGRVGLKGAKVTLVVSAGPELTDVPPLTGRLLAEARPALSAAGLVIGTMQERHDRQPQGTILGQDPPPGKARKGDPVNLIVSGGPEIISLPDLGGKPFAEAQSLLSEKGFDVTREDVFNDAPAGTVVAQDPGVGKMASQGTLVKLSVSKGPQPFPMPDLKGKSCNEARAAAPGLTFAVLSSGGQQAACGDNRVLEQDPLPGTTVKKGREATLYVSG